MAEVNLPKGISYESAMALRSAIAGSRPLYVECRLTLRDGQERFYLWTPTLSWLDDKTLRRWANELLARWGLQGKATLRRR